ncbi:MAG: alpha/beta fold hydrolase [Alphaproteobacteria bacterium]|nr:alpha/beta fold hydrolase [Alphaproteobacteria bacterium]
MLHGFAGSPYNFHPLLASMKQKQMGYYAPLFTGFGLQDFHILRTIKASDWLRDAIYAYDLLAQVADKVSIVGHSNGGVLACLLAQIRPVHKMILVEPYFVGCDDDKKSKDLVFTPVRLEMVKTVCPIAEKSHCPGRSTYSDFVDPKAGAENFAQASVSVSSLSVLWKLQDQVDCKKIKADSIFVLYGAQSLSINIKAGLKKLDDAGWIYKTIMYSNSAHTPQLDFDKDAVNADIVAILQGQD